MNREELLSRARFILAFDSSGGLLVGILVLSLSAVLAGWHGIPESVLIFTGFANVAYGSYSGSLRTYAHLKELPAWPFLLFLIVANIAWAPVCVYLLYMNQATITWLGVLHLLGEGAFVGTLGVIEYRILRPAARED